MILLPPWSVFASALRVKGNQSPLTTSLHCWSVRKGSSSKISFQSLVPRTASGRCLRFGEKAPRWGFAHGYSQVWFQEHLCRGKQGGRGGELFNNTVMMGISDYLTGSSRTGIDFWSCSSWVKGPGTLSSYIGQALGADSTQWGSFSLGWGPFLEKGLAVGPSSWPSQRQGWETPEGGCGLHRVVSLNKACITALHRRISTEPKRSKGPLSLFRF